MYLRGADNPKHVLKQGAQAHTYTLPGSNSITARVLHRSVSLSDSQIT